MRSRLTKVTRRNWFHRGQFFFEIAGLLAKHKICKANLKSNKAMST